MKENSEKDFSGSADCLPPTPENPERAGDGIAAASSPMISVRGLTVGYSGKIILKNLNFDIARCEIVCILGGSGCGKSTLLKHLIGLYSPLSGDILIDGESIVHASPPEKRAMMSRFGVAYQSGALFRSMTLFENIALPLQEQDLLSEAEIRERVLNKLALVNLNGYEDYYPADLSGGMIKRCAFARAMALNPHLLFFDEPSAGLDPLSSAELDQLILKIRKETSATIVMVTHELPSIFTVSDRIIMLDRSTQGIIGDGSPSDLRDHSSNEYLRNFLTRSASVADGRAAEKA